MNSSPRPSKATGKMNAACILPHDAQLIVNSAFAFATILNDTYENQRARRAVEAA